ncbi:MAG TPA: DNA mismatch repair protein [Polyangiaceae bacterium]|nr:DNA mismatch repair protein [Polyangiaceae bacterium]
MPTVPDLLSPEPTLRVDEGNVRRAIAFAFAAGDGADSLASALDEARAPASTHDPAQFAGEIFLPELVKKTFAISIEGRTFTPSQGYLERVLAHPPKDPATVAFRRAILDELARSPALRADLEHTYLELVAFRDALTSPSHGSIVEEHQHRIDTLSAIRALVEGMSSRFDGAASGLGRIRAFGQALREVEEFTHLVELLDYEGGFATVNARLQVGSDGSVRGFELTRVEESASSPFYRSPFGRLFTRLVLFLRGYRFGELEVMARLIDRVFQPFERAAIHFVQLLGDLELYLGALTFRDVALSRGLAMSFAEMCAAPREGGEAAPRREILGLFNPLLVGERGAPKTCDIVTRRHDAIVLVTGPNSGGKTRLLQAIAIAQLFAQNGLFVPAESARLAWTEGLFVSLHHEVSASQKEGRLGTELLRIRELFEEVEPGDLVIVDELCSGTNPSEAEAIIRLVLELLAELHPQVFVTTHFLEFAAELAASPPLERLEFLQAALDERHRPTYGFVAGVAKTSLAAETAARLGVTLEELASLVARKKATMPAARALPAELTEAGEPLPDLD